MRNKFLGVVCFLYSGIIFYVWLGDILKNFLAPQMQLYLKASLIPLIIMGIVLFGRDSHHKFRVSDLVLLLPLIMLFTSGDGRLTTSFANNRMANINKVINSSKSSVIKEEEEIEKEPVKDIKEEEKDNSLEQEDPEEIITEEDIYFDVTDEVYNELANYITYEPRASAFEGKTIRVRGFVVKNPSFTSDKYFAIGKYTVSCCVADAGFVGFVAEYDKSKIRDDAWYEIEGVLAPGKDKYQSNIMVIKVTNIKKIDSSEEELYIYPCYGYGDGKCEELYKYNLDYGF